MAASPASGGSGGGGAAAAPLPQTPQQAPPRVSVKPGATNRAMLQELGEDLASTPLAVTLGNDPAARDAESVEEALDWWLAALPAAGTGLAPELRAPRPALLQAFARGRIAICAPGQRLAEESDEIRHFTVVLLGTCRLRCKASGAPRPKTPELESSEDATGEAAAVAAAVDSDGLVTCGTVRAGDSFGQPPGEQRSIYDIIVVERSMLLLLTAEDYAATLRPFQRELQAKAVEFLQQYRICPQATASALQRLSVMLRLREVRRGAYVMRSGRLSRHVWLLRKGGCAILAPEEGVASLAPEGDTEEEEERRASDEERQERDRLERMRLMCRSAQEQQAAAAEEARRSIVCQYARGKLAESLAQGGRPKSPVPGGPAPRASAVLQKPGTTLGEEVLLSESFRDMLSTRYYYTARVTEDSLFYVADVATFRHLAMCTGAESVSWMINEKLNRRVVQLLRSDRVTRKIARQGRELQKQEVAKWDRPQIKMPRSTGYDGPSEVEDVNEWLQVTYEHRKAPLNEMNPTSLSCLEVLGSKGRAMVFGTAPCGPGVSSMLRAFSDEAAIRKFRRDGLGPVGLPRRRRPPASTNPMGERVAASARYFDVSPYTTSTRDETGMVAAAAETTAFPEGMAGVDATAVSSIFFQTEPPEIELTPPPSIAAGALDPRPPPLGAEIELTPPPGSSLAMPVARQPPRSSSVPSLPRLEDTASPSRGGGAAAAAGSGGGTGGIGGGAARSSSFSFNLEDDPQDEMRDDEEMPSIIPLQLTRRLQASQSATSLRSRGERRDGGSGSGHPAAKLAAAERKRYVVNQFKTAVTGKSVLVLTDKADARKAICGALMEAQTALVFLKSTNELWQHFRSEKNHFHALILDLTKFELQVESVIRTIRQNERYSFIPIVVLAAERELSEVVRLNCSFVVFKPVVATMLREALLWCFDRRLVQGLFKQEAQSSPQQSTSQSLGSGGGRQATSSAQSSPQSASRGSGGGGRQMMVMAGGGR